MSELTNRAAYLKGLADGMKLDKEKDETKLLVAIIDFLNDTAAEIEAIDNEQGFIADQLDDLEDEVYVIGNEIFDEYEDCDDDDQFEVCCNGCGEELIVSATDLMEGEVYCPTCGAEIEFDFDCCDDDCE